MYQIEITETAKKFLKKIPKQDVEIILKKSTLLKITPLLTLRDYRTISYTG